MASKTSKLKKITIPANLSGLFHQHHDRILADDSLSDLDVLLFSIYLQEYNSHLAGCTYGLCKETFQVLGRKEDAFRKIVYTAKKSNFLEEKDKKLYLLIKGLKKLRMIMGQTEKSPVYVIKAGQNFSAIKLFEEFVSKELGNKKEILLCDPYVSHNTLFPFTALKNVSSLKILSSNVFDSAKFEEYRKKLSKEYGISVEVKINKKIHERYIICENKCWAIGSSIKDLGNKDAVIREISEVTKSMKEMFFERWGE